MFVPYVCLCLLPLLLFSILKLYQDSKIILQFSFYTKFWSIFPTMPLSTKFQVSDQDIEAYIRNIEVQDKAELQKVEQAQDTEYILFCIQYLQPSYIFGSNLIWKNVMFEKCLGYQICTKMICYADIAEKYRIWIRYIRREESALCRN